MGIGIRENSYKVSLFHIHEAGVEHSWRDMANVHLFLSVRAGLCTKLILNDHP